MNFNISIRFIRIWQRNLTVYRESWKINFLPPLLEPFFYLLAFGIGFSGMIGRVSYASKEVSYVLFIAPALVAINIMNNAFFENTYGSFVRMYYQKTFDAMMATPLNAEEIITGEIVWGATKAVIGTIIMLTVISFFGLVSYPAGILIVFVAFLGGIAFGSVAMFFTGMVSKIELFNLPVFLFITPMFLFSGTFFPITGLPVWAQYFALVLPLTHLVNLVRALSFGLFNSELLISLSYLIVFCLVMFPLAIFKMRRRLIK
ncbi:MAG: ABC transporter permease [Deltaproteobacteria bacterium]|nr:ABC transporter permease [Deltaproteobacteria bacterium]